jgi:hypothetical protein
VVHDRAQGRRIETVAGIPLLGAIRNGDKQVHIGSKVDMITRLGRGFFDSPTSILIVHHIHERSKGPRDLSPRDSPRANGHCQVIAAIPRPWDSVPHKVKFVAALHRGWVVAPDCVLNNSKHRSDIVRVQDMSFGGVVRPEDVRGEPIAQGLFEIIEVKGDYIRNLLTLEINDAENIRAPHRE